MIDAIDSIEIYCIYPLYPINKTTPMIDNKAIFNISYGLFVLVARQGDKDNACIINVTCCS